MYIMYLKNYADSSILSRLFLVSKCLAFSMLIQCIILGQIFLQLILEKTHYYFYSRLLLLHIRVLWDIVLLSTVSVLLPNDLSSLQIRQIFFFSEVTVFLGILIFILFHHILQYPTIVSSFKNQGYGLFFHLII